MKHLVFSSLESRMHHSVRGFRRCATRGRVAVLAVGLLLSLGARAGSGFGVTVTHPVRSAWQATVEQLGEVYGYGRLPIQAPMSGWLRGPRLDQGVKVKAGTVLAVIEPPGFAARLSTAKAALKLAGIRLTQITRLYHGRYSARIQLDQARYNLRAAKEAVNGLEREQEGNRLRAPADGTVYYRLPPGAFVNDVNTTPVIAYLDVDLAPWLRIGVTPKRAQDLRRGMRLELRRGVWHGPGIVFSISGSALLDGLVEVLIRPPGNAPLLRGEWAHVRLPGGSGDAWRLPRAALVMQGATAWVYVVRRGRATAVAVALKAASGHSVWVSGPLRAGDEVIVNGAGRIRGTTPVHVVGQIRGELTQTGGSGQ